MDSKTMAREAQELRFTDRVLFYMLGFVTAIVFFIISYWLMNDDSIKLNDDHYQSCAWSVSEAQAEDELCVTWVDQDGNVVVGPAWQEDRD